jgi:WD40 repeat protein
MLPPPLRRLLAGVLLAGAGACEHSVPFTPTGSAPTEPFAPGSVSRLTLNPSWDGFPRWLPDGSGIVYAFQRSDRPEPDRCFGILPAPPRGGARTGTICATTAASLDSTDGYALPVIRGDRIAYVRTHSRIGAIAPDAGALVLAPWSDLTNARQLRPLPYTANGRNYGTIDHLRWLDETSLVYVGELVAYPRACSGCPPDTLTTGLDIVRLIFNDQAVTLLPVPSTDFASGVAVQEGDPNTIYYTLGGDSRVYRRTLSSGAVIVVHDFGQITRDLDIVGNRMVVVVGGAVTFAFDSVLGMPVQRDGGGALWLFDLGTGGATPLATSLPFRRPSLAPDGRFVAAEVDGFLTPDLWLVDIP